MLATSMTDPTGFLIGFSIGIIAAGWALGWWRPR